MSVGGPLVNEERGDRVTDDAVSSCCRIPSILAPDQAVGISHRDGGCGSRSPGFDTCYSCRW
jgi:hypothetical protein